METPRYAIDKIDEAVASGDLEPQTGTGKPIPGLTRDPDWWVRAFLGRERYAERLPEMVKHRRGVIARAVASEDLTEARAMITDLNDIVERWNDEVPHDLSMEPVSEIWLITERAQVPGR